MRTQRLFYLNSLWAVLIVCLLAVSITPTQAGHSRHRLQCVTTPDANVIEEVYRRHHYRSHHFGQSAPSVYRYDNDGDDYLIERAGKILACEAQGDYQSLSPNKGVDCDDTDPDVHPGMTEIPFNGKDDDCDPETPDDDGIACDLGSTTDEVLTSLAPDVGGFELIGSVAFTLNSPSPGLLCDISIIYDYAVPEDFEDDGVFTFDSFFVINETDSPERRACVPLLPCDD